MVHKIEVAPSGRAACRSCGEKIGKGELRFGESVTSQYGEAFEWHHLKCAASKKPVLLGAALEHFEGEVPERAALDAAMQAAATAPAAGSKKKDPAGALPSADLAPTGRAKCIECGEAIPAKSVRIAVEREIDTGTFAAKGAGYLHPTCAEAWAGTQNVDFAELVADVRANTALLELPPPFVAAGGGA